MRPVADSQISIDYHPVELLAACKRLENDFFRLGRRSRLVARARELGWLAEACAERDQLDPVARMYAAAGLLAESRRLRAQMRPRCPPRLPLVSHTGAQIHFVQPLEATLVAPSLPVRAAPIPTPEAEQPTLSSGAVAAWVDHCASRLHPAAIVALAMAFGVLIAYAARFLGAWLW